MTLPPTCTVTGAWLNADETAATGQIVITPVAAAPGASYIVVARPIIAVLVAGAISETLVNNSDFPSLQYQVTEQIDGTSADSYIVTPAGSTVNLQTASRGGAIAPIYVLASAVGAKGGPAGPLDLVTGLIPADQVPGGSGGGVTITSPDATITVGGTGTAPTLDVAAIGQAQVTGLSAALSANASAITAETVRAEAAEAALYTKPSGGIPASDLASAVRTDLTLAGTAVQSVTAADATVVVVGTATAPTVAVGTIGEAAVTNLTTNLATLTTGVSSNATAISAETSRAEAAEALLAPLASPALTGTPTAPTKPVATNSTAVATTAYTDAAVGVETARAETAEALAAQKSANLSDLASASTARTNLGLGSAATENVGTGAGTVAAGNDSRITGALQAGNNLSDLASDATALTNLGAVPTTRTVGAGTGLTGGGDLSANRSFAVAYGTSAGTAAQGNDARIVGAAQTGNNLSDLANAGTARTNLGLGTAATISSTAGGDLAGTLPTPTVTATHLSAPLPIAQGGTGSGTQNFVDLATPQTVAGTKTFSAAPVVPAAAFPESAVSGLTADLAARLQAANNLSDVASAATARGNLAVQALYTSTAVQTGTYTASVGQLVPCNATAGSFTVTLPTGAAAGAQVAVKLLATAGTNTVTVAAGGTDIINLAGTTTASLSLAAESFELTASGTGTWYLAGGQKSLGSLDTRYGLTLNVLNYGAKRNRATSATGAMTASSAVLTDTNGAFTAANVGQYITVVGAGAAGVDLSTTILSVQSGTSITLTVAASTTVTGATYGYGTSDTAAINAAITAAGTIGATVYFPPGGYVLGSPTVPANNISFVGAGIGNTTLYPFGTAAAVLLQASTGSPLTNFAMAHLTIDGVHQAGAYNVATKGIFVQYTNRCTFEDLVVQNCVATGIGTDFLAAGTVIHNCRAINNGRLNHAGVGGGGGNGIGIGTGGFTVEDWVVSDCYATGNGRYGIMMECQFSALATMPTGMRISNCYSSANFGHGYGDAGGNGAIWSNCVAASNAFDGFSVDNGTIGATAQPSGNSVYIGCVASSNSRYGFSYQPTASNAQSVAGAGNLLYVGCKSNANTSLGFNIGSVASHPVSGVTYLSCEAYGNGGSGLQVQTASNDIKISDGKFNANGQTSSTSKVGVLIGAAVTGLHITGCRMYDDGGTVKQAYALQVATSVTVTTATVVNNDFRGNLTGAVNMLGTWASAVLDSNAGYDGPANRAGGPSSAARLRPDTAANWLSTAPTLGLGEVGYETDTRQFKVGDGATAYTGLGYGAPAYLDQLAAAAIAAVAVTMDPMNAQGSPGITTGRPYFCLAHIAANTTISAMDVDIVSVGATTTVSTTFMGIYDVATGNLLGQTADFSSSLPASQGTVLLKVPITGGTPIAAQNIGRPVYLVFLATLAGSGAALTVIGGRQFGSNQSAASPNGRLFTNLAGTTLTALPGTVPSLVQTSGFSMPYLGAYH